ncbi:hypothetical protein PTSG_05866 [Salpingoeca rosetta]|uniref:EIF-4F 25 kDa subunit n=1 Tax=Salpingoeca rosetta (strain ATCC 50818 / BSB-021) TaxID=946362 RepID=F2UD07_SALR5|nr:uncharacterized protein PTSG_05866 [Salpingoeca rosetta]EGD74502.1 hypothetical protein PTSG_05866 [Salpingoeca rosetta]|eukprot:XP_004992759.1 hypothetical protein PTSG_05866 [Salpingoeca rosetta]
MSMLERKSSEQEQPNNQCELAVPIGPEPEHKLCDTWCLYYDNPMDLPRNPTDEQYKQNLKKVYVFDTLEQFWRLYNNIKAVEEMSGCNFHLFRNGVSPTWEDPFNERGGKWVCQVGISNDLWMRTILSVIGGLFGEYQDHVCGAVAALKKSKKRDRLSLWLKDVSDREACMAIGRKWKDICRELGKIEFLPHQVAQKAKSSYFSESKYMIN